MKNYLFIFQFFISVSLTAQTISVQKTEPLITGNPTDVGLSAERLEWIDSMLKKEMKDGHFPGVVALIARNGKIVFHRAMGVSDANTKRVAQKDDIFRIASQSKAITATAVMMLWEKALFRLDDPISKYIPEFKNPVVLDKFSYSDTSYTTISAEQEITIRHLLTHTSGIGYGIIDGDERMKMIYEKAGITDLFTTEKIRIEESILKLAKLPLHHNPGENFTYSEGLDVLGYFVEVISGKPFDQFLRENIFDPLGMNDTWFYLPEEKISRLVKVQYIKEGKWSNYPITFYDPDYPAKGAKCFFSGGAGLSSTAKDYAIFLQMYLNGGEYNGIRILSPTTINMMMENQIGDLWGGNKTYGIAFGLVNEKGEAAGGIGGVGTFDWGGYFNTQYFADPSEQIIGILMKQTQGKTGDQSGWKFRQLVFSAIDE